MFSQTAKDIFGRVHVGQCHKVQKTPMPTLAEYGLSPNLFLATQRNANRREGWRRDGLTHDLVSAVLFAPLTFLVVPGQRDRVERWCVERALDPILSDKEWTVCAP